MEVKSPSLFAKQDQERLVRPKEVHDAGKDILGDIVGRQVRAPAKGGASPVALCMLSTQQTTAWGCPGLTGHEGMFWFKRELRGNEPGVNAGVPYAHCHGEFVMLHVRIGESFAPQFARIFRRPLPLLSGRSFTTSYSTTLPRYKNSAIDAQIG